MTASGSLAAAGLWMLAALLMLAHLAGHYAGLWGVTSPVYWAATATLVTTTAVTFLWGDD